jgi:hypothetical protein
MTRKAKSALVLRETALTILLSAARLWETRALIEKSKKKLLRPRLRPV